MNVTDSDKKWRNAASNCIRRCEEEYAGGTEPAKIRQICRDFTASFAPVVAQMDFSPEFMRSEGGMRPSDAKELADQFGGRWWKSDQYYAGVEYSAMRQPCSLAMPDVWMIAAVGGDADLARQVAEPYRVREPHQLVQYEVRQVLLRHALASDREGETALLEKLRPGYPADFPPMLIEFPQGVIHQDVKLLHGAIKKVSTRFKGKWDVKKHRAWYDKQIKQYGTGSFRSPGTWEETVERTKRDLFNYHYIISWWALAWLNVARWRGMDEVFANPKVFSQWVPLELAAG